ncbi:MAG: SRPBCC domain-containing protein [Bacteroidota bacterium]|nr:SRPBCC domain-containing protein [Bacteroidota bacterium]
MQKEIKHTFFFPHPTEIVWDYLTKPELLSQWLMENDIQPIVGHEFQFRSKPALEIEFDGIVYCEILKVVPFKQLSYSWKCSPANGTFKIDTVVMWTLGPKDNGTELNLHQTGFKEKENDLFYMAMYNGWTKQVEKFLQTLNAI